MKSLSRFGVRTGAVAAGMALAGLAPGLSFGAPASFAFSFHDDFSSAVSEVIRLNGSQPAGASVPWNASSNVGFRKEGDRGAVVARDQISFVGWVALPASDGTEKTARRITIDGTLRPIPAEGKQNWVAIGFGSIPEKRTIQWAHGVFVLVGSKGLYEVLLNPTGGSDGLVSLQHGKISDVSPGNPPVAVPVRLVYDQVAHTLSLIVNHQSVMQDYAIDESRHFTPSTQAVGFSGYAQKTDAPLLTEFSVSLSQ